jgi:GMP synthase-like glutamine amidotransferase
MSSIDDSSAHPSKPGLRLHWLQHQHYEGLGHIETWAAERGVAVSRTALWGDESLPDLTDFDVLVVMGGPMNVYEHAAYPWLIDEKAFIRRTIDARKPVLGICLGAQLLADQLGGGVAAAAHAEIGWHPVWQTTGVRRSRLLEDFGDEFLAFHWHGDTFMLPPGAELLASSEACPTQAFVWRDQVLGLQFHPEVTVDDAQCWIEQHGVAQDRYVQTAEEMLREPQRFEANRRLTGALMDRFAALAI